MCSSSTSRSTRWQWGDRVARRWGPRGGHNVVMTRGTLRVYLGAAPGVGKTVAMLSEAQRRHERGTDVVIAVCEAHGRPFTAALMTGLERIPTLTVVHRGTGLPELDVAAVIARRPEVALVDELAHSNVPGSARAKRWEDIEEIRQAGIDVISTVNIQHLESLNDVVEAITGVRQRETVPDDVVRSADQIELVDMSPEALRRRLAHGNVYAAEKVDAALANYFREGNLAALRELSLLWVADRVEEGLDRYRADHAITEQWPTRERVVVALTGGPEGRTLLRRAAQISSRGAGGELLAVYVSPPDGLVDARLEGLADLRQLTLELGGTFHTVKGEHVADALLEFARGVNARQIVIGASRRKRWQEVLRPGVGQRVVDASGDIDVHLVTHEHSRTMRAPLHLAPELGSGRTAAGWLLATAGSAALTAALLATPAWHDLPLEVLLYLLLTVVVAVLGGLWPAIAAAVADSLILNWYFTPPVHEFTISDPQNLVALMVFLVVAIAVSSVVHLSERRAVAARAAQREAAALAASAEELLGEREQLAALLRQAVEFFGIDAAGLVSRRSVRDPWVLVAATNGFEVEAIRTASVRASVDDRHTLVLLGRVLTGQDRRLVSAFAARAGALLHRDELVAQAQHADALAKDNRARTALLAAVSHDLRTPLASIKAAVSSLRQGEVAFSLEDQASLLETIEASTDRLTALVTNLLDMSRLQSGAVTPRVSQVDVEDAAGLAASHLPGGDRVQLRLAPDLPQVEADQGLLDRVLANVLENALRHSPGRLPVTVRAAAMADRVEVRVVDTGTGVPDGAKELIFAPFQRYGDVPQGTGVGLGLAVARGLMEAMGGSITAEDTPGGGLTIVVRLPRAPRDGPQDTRATAVVPSGRTDRMAP
jgi:two-component system, OmpR family, sensor histidine kinase KdpD